MGNDKILFSSKTVELSETKEYLELTNRLCYYNMPNLNNVTLPIEGAEDRAKTLINMPVVGSYTTNDKGEPTFKGHECFIDSDDNLVFLTDAIGTHTDVYIENDDVNVFGTIENLPCLFAKCRIWTRNKNVVAAVKRLFNLGKLYTSWELSVLAYEFKDGIKTLTDYSFLSNCVLGWDTGVSPAYGEDAKAVHMSSREGQLMIAEAFSKDKIADKSVAESLSKDLLANQKDSSDIKTKEQEEENLGKEKTTKDEALNTATEAVDSTENEVAPTETPVDNVEAVDEATAETDTTEEVSTEAEVSTDENSSVEVSALTEWDLRRAIERVCTEKLGGDWCWVAFHFPLEKTVWVEQCCRDSELSYMLFTYEAVGDVITVSEPTPVTLTVSISSVNSTISQLQSDVSERDNTIAELNSTIQTQVTEISSLTIYKDKFEQAEQDRIEKEQETARTELRSYAEKSNCFTKDELDSDEIATLIFNVNTSEIKSMIADRVIANLSTEKPVTTTAAKKESTPVRETVETDAGANYKSVMKDFLRRN